MNLFDSITDIIGREIINSAKQIYLPANSTVFYQGANCENFLLVIKGTIKVFTRAINGREIVLYRVNKGQSCTLTTTCLLASNHYPAEGITENEVAALVIPLKDFNRGLAQSTNFRELVFNTYAQRLSEVIALVGEISFNRIDIRLAKQLLHLVNNENTLFITHQYLATELGSAREVISRQLKTFESQGLLNLSRGKIELKDINAIEALASTPLI
ncbi:MAG: Crp/Fnr family transcriptional regulator [Colwellia sp.]|nr:Crp/Fnr family transcriptional regulator [Colwellia sp.]